MRKITNSELLQIQLDILRDVDSFCRNNGIEYFLVGGTGIGAVRHGGYIPWDDDIDIGMTRPNYNLFISSFNGKFKNLTLYVPELNWNYYAPYANVCDNRTILYEGGNGHNGFDVGVKIDVFPYDAVPTDEKDFESLRQDAININNLCVCKRQILHKMHINQYRRIAYVILHKLKYFFRRYSSLQKELHNIAMKTPWEGAEYLEKIVFPYTNNKPCKREVFEKYIDVKFENLIVRNVKEYDVYLQSVFGDYMQLPPEDQRVPNHNFKAFWKD